MIIGTDTWENNALIACLLLPLGFEKENITDASMRSDVIKSINLFGDNAFDSIASWGSDNESVSDIVEILEHLKNLSNLNKNNETLII